MSLFLVCYAVLFLGSVYMLQKLKVANPSAVNGILNIFSNKNPIMKYLNLFVLVLTPFVLFVFNDFFAAVFLFILMYPTLVIWCADIKTVKIKK